MHYHAYNSQRKAELAIGSAKHTAKFELNETSSAEL
jgi:hypothetical protein